MRSYLLCELLELGVAGRLCRQLRRKLALPAWANTKDHVPTRNRKRNPSAKIGLDHRERKIHTGSYTGGGPDTTVLNMNGITVDERRWTKAL